MLIAKSKAQAGWFLFEALFSLIIGFFVLSAATYFFFSSCGALTKMADQWHRIEVLERWRLFMNDALNSSLAYSRCDHTDSVNLSVIDQTRYQLHTCRFVDSSWRWIDTSYYVAKKEGVSYLYEKLAGKRGVAWIPSVKSIRAYFIGIGEIKKTHLFVIDWTPEQALGAELSMHFVFHWSDEEK
jgi:hypothetical protein